MKVAVICEFSGVVRNAFSNIGHDATSFDLLPTLIPGNHVIGDITKIPMDYWKQFDLAICHPPCQYLSYAGIAHWNKPGRDKLRKSAMNFFMFCVNLPIDKICVENPVGYPLKVYRKPDQIIHPYYFGDSYSKRTCLWLKNLSPLYYKNNYKKPEPIYISKSGRAIHFTDAAHKKNGLERWQIRSITSKAIASAMAEQWGNDNYLNQQTLNI